MDFIVLEKLGLTTNLGLAVFVLYPLCNIVYNLTLHPLARFPGPLLWRSLRFPYIYSMWSGKSHIHWQELHRKYGPIVRVAPNELSFADTAAWNDIYSNHGGDHSLLKPKEWYAPSPGRANSIIDCRGKEHTRTRKKMEPAFTERATMSQEGIVQKYVNLLMRRLGEKIISVGPERRDAGDVNITEWLTWTTLDITGDLAFGEAFGCLEQSAMNEWMGSIFGSLQFMILAALLRYYPWLTWLMEKMTPQKLKDAVVEHWRIVEKKVDTRLCRETSRADFIGYWTKNGKVQDSLTLHEVYSNAFIMMLAGTETTSTSLSGIIYQLVHKPSDIARLTKEVREKFQKEEDITFSALKDLPFLNAVIWEGFRLSTPFPLGFKRMTPPGGGTICGQHIPANTIVFQAFIALYFDENRFYDAHAFHPERWLEEATTDPNSSFYNDDRAALQPFEVGRNVCIGKPLAMAQTRLILAKLFWRFDIEKSQTAAGNMVWQEQKTCHMIDKDPFDINLKFSNMISGKA